MVQLVKFLTLGFGSGLWSQGYEMEPQAGLRAQQGVCLKGSLPCSVPLPSFSQINK